LRFCFLHEFIVGGVDEIVIKVRSFNPIVVFKLRNRIAQAEWSENFPDAQLYFLARFDLARESRRHIDLLCEKEIKLMQ
jgi:hypothetical protein